MVSEEAREWLRSIKDNYIHGGDEAFDNARREALDMAIKALRCEPCDDAVSRNLMTNTLGATCIAKRDEKGDLVALCSIDHLPSVTPKPRTGHWIYDRTRDWDGECKYECSECGMGSDVDYAYCMRCGAKMQEVKE